MSSSKLKTILLVEDDLPQVCYVREVLPENQFQVQHAATLVDALQQIAQGGIDVILLDLGLPDSQGIRTLQAVINHCKTLPIVIFTALEDEEVGIQAVQMGAQDYIFKKEITGTVLSRSIRYSMERKRSEELTRAQDQALEASRLKSVFLRNMSHEFRTPLAGILGVNELLRCTEMTDEQLKYVDNIRTCAIDLLELVTHVLEISNIELGGIKIKDLPFNPVALVESVLRDIQPSARQKDLKVVLEPIANVPTSVSGDRVKLEQVLGNLAKNAVKFTQCGEIRLALSFESQDEAQVFLRFTVSDTGIGIAEAERKLLFLPFSQVDSSKTRRYGGAGLGLAISKRLIELMGGQISFESEKNKGSTFWFIVPLRRIGS